VERWSGFAFLRKVLRRAPSEHETEEELRGHIQERAEDLERGGLTRAEAQRQARIEFGGYQKFKEECHEAGGARFIENLIQDARFGLRMLRKSPGFAAVAVLTLALGIGANTAIFSVVYAVLLRPLPFPNPQQLVRFTDARPQDRVEKAGCSYTDFKEWQEQNHLFSEMAGDQQDELTLTGRGEPAIVLATVVTPGMFSMMGVKPLAGRAFVPEDGQGATPVAVISENLWRNRLGADPRIVGSTIELDKRAFAVIGVMPAGFRYPPAAQSEELWIPLVQDPLFGPWMKRPGGHWLHVVGRLRPGVSLAEAQSEMDIVNGRVTKEFPDQDAGWIVRLVPLNRDITGDVRRPLLVLLGAAGLLLLIACANVGNLLLARASSRAKEMGLRVALGAGRSRIARQLFTESAVLGLVGGVAGILLAWSGVRVLSAMLPAELPQVHAIRVDGWMLAFALALSVAASVVFGLAPVLFTVDRNPLTNLREGAERAGGGRRGLRMRSVVCVTEIALAMVLLVAASLMTRSLIALVSVQPGFDSEHVVMAEISLPQFEYSTAQQWTTFADELMARIQAQPGLKDSALAVPLPLADGYINLGFEIAGRPPSGPGVSQTADYAAVSPDYFHAMRIPLLKGRYFSAEDSSAAPRVAIISEAFARVYFPNEDPTGRDLVFGFPPNGNATRRIVGIAGDIRDVALSHEPGPMMYVPFAQAPFGGEAVVVRSSMGESSLASAIREQVRKIDKDLPVTEIGTMAEIVDGTTEQPRFETLLVGAFGALGLTLAVVGIYGVISYGVSRRTREIGVRMALGAEPGSITGMVIRGGLALAAAGIAVGGCAALALTRLLQDLLYQIKPGDPATMAGVAIALALVALAACYVPARRAMKVDPMVALRYE
jgi:putative ABC transport system permease protein